MIVWPLFAGYRFFLYVSSRSGMGGHLVWDRLAGWKRFVIRQPL